MSDRDEAMALQDTLFVALCRPAMMWGVPRDGALLNVCCSLLACRYIGNGSWHWLIYLGPVVAASHMVMRIGVARDHNWFRTKKLGLETKGYGTATWGGSSLTPIPRCGWPSKAKDLPIAF